MEHVHDFSVISFYGTESDGSKTEYRVCQSKTLGRHCLEMIKNKAEEIKKGMYEGAPLTKV